MNIKDSNVVDIFKFGVLAIMIAVLIFYLIIPLVAKSNKDSFAEEVIKFAKLTDDQYILLESDSASNYKNKCIDIRKLIKTDSKNYTGVIIVKNENDENLEKYIYVSNGKYVYNSSDKFKNIKLDDILDYKYSKPLYSSCENYEKGIMH